MAQEEAEYLLKKANELRQEEEDEIKRLNEVFFYSNNSLCRIQFKLNMFFEWLLAYLERQSSRHSRRSTRGEVQHSKGGEERREAARFDDGSRPLECDQNPRGDREEEET